MDGDFGKYPMPRHGAKHALFCPLSPAVRPPHSVQHGVARSRGALLYPMFPWCLDTQRLRDEFKSRLIFKRLYFFL